MQERVIASMRWYEQRVLALSLSLFRLLLRLYPVDFRREFASHMLQVFHAYCLTTIQHTGASRLFRQWPTIIWDLVTNALREQYEERKLVMQYLIATKQPVQSYAMAAALLSLGAALTFSFFVGSPNLFWYYAGAGCFVALLASLVQRTKHVWTQTAFQALVWCYAVACIGSSVFTFLSIGGVTFQNATRATDTVTAAIMFSLVTLLLVLSAGSALLTSRAPRAALRGRRISQRGIVAAGIVSLVLMLLLKSPTILSIMNGIRALETYSADPVVRTRIFETLLTMTLTSLFLPGLLILSILGIVLLMQHIAQRQVPS